MAAAGSQIVGEAQAAPAAGPVRTWRLYAPGPYGQVHIHAAAPAAGAARKPPLVCFHTTPQSGAEFAVFMGEMARDRLVLAPDTPGFGGSERPAAPPTLADYAAALAEAVDACGLIAADTPYDVLGNHTGAVIATEIAVSRPARIRRLVLAGAPLLSEAGRLEMLERYGKPNPFFSDPDYVATTFKSQVLTEGAVPQARRFDLFIEGLRAGPPSWWGSRAVMTYPLEAGLRRLSQPTLFLVAKDVMAANTRDAARLAPHPTLIDLEDQTQSPAFDLHAKLMADAARGFLDG